MFESNFSILWVLININISHLSFYLKLFWCESLVFGCWNRVRIQHCCTALNVRMCLMLYYMSTVFEYSTIVLY